MSTFAPLFLSGSTTGRQIKVATTSTAGTLIHTAVSGTSNIDEITIYAVNSSTSAVKLTIEWGGVTVPDDLIEVTISPEAGYELVIPRLRLQNALVVRAWAGTANVILINGHVDRYTA